MNKIKKEQCQICKRYFNNDGSDDYDIYEYRGFLACEKHFDELCEKVEEKRKFVMEVTEKSIKSQRVGKFVNSRKKYHLGNVASDGLPIIKPQEPLVLQDYENGIL